MCQCNNINCGCTPEEYTSGIVYDGQPFVNSQLAAIKPNCNNLNDLLELWGTIIGGLLDNVLVLDIGAWDMDATASLNVAHGLSANEFASIEDVAVLIDDDGVTLKTPLNQDGSFSVDATNVMLARNGGGLFDAVAYDDAVQNRGKIVIKYTKD